MSTDPWKLLKNRVQASWSLDRWDFAPDEHARLLELRAQLLNHSVDVEMDLDECRLLFARWLVEHGKLSDQRC